MGTVLNVVGIFFIIFSLICIKKLSSKELEIYEEMLEVEYNVRNYYSSIKDLLEDFDIILEDSLNKIDLISKADQKAISNSKLVQKQEKNYEDKGFSPNKALIFHGNENKDLEQSNYNKVIELKRAGLSNKEIAKKLSMGIREVEVYLKISNIR